MVSLLVPQGAHAADITSNLLGYWKLDDGSGTTPIDSSGNGNTGLFVSTPTWTTGVINSALDFDQGSSESVEFGSGISVTGAMTACAWVLGGSFSLAGEEDVIVATGNSDLSNTQFALTTGGESSTTEKSISFFWSDDSGNYEYNATSDTILAGEWHHVCGVRTSGGVGSIYIDGTSRSVTPTGNFSVTTGSGVTAIGKAGDNDGYYWDGVIDEVRIYDRELSADDIAYIYAQEAGPSSPRALQTTSVTGEVDLSWSAPLSAGLSGIETYAIWRATSPFIETADATLLTSFSTSSGTTYSDTSVSRGSTYYYGITASNDIATSSLSNIRSSSSNSGRVIRLGGLLRTS